MSTSTRSLLSEPRKPSHESKGECECQKCPDFDSRLYECNHGTRTKCVCTKKAVKLPEDKANTCSPCCLEEPEPVTDPERTQSLMKMLKFNQACNCKVVCRAVRADVHRYLGMLDRHIHKIPPESPEQNATPTQLSDIDLNTQDTAET